MDNDDQDIIVLLHLVIIAVANDSRWCINDSHFKSKMVAALFLEDFCCNLDYHWLT